LRIVNFLGNQIFCGSRTETKTYEEIRSVFYQRHYRHGVYRFLPTAGDEGDHDYSSSGSTVTHSIAQQASQDDCWLGTQAC
jgi:hypothetical protein